MTSPGQVERMHQAIQHWKMKIAQNRQECEERNQQLRGEKEQIQKHFQELSLIFLAYCRSILGSDTAEDAMEMEMAEFHDFVSECRLETKAINFDMSASARLDPSTSGPPPPCLACLSPPLLTRCAIDRHPPPQ